MKKIILLTLIISQVLHLSAQSLTVTGSNLIMYNSVTDLGLDTLDPCLETHSSVTVKNISNKEYDILCEKNIISESSGANNYFCWGGSCYPPIATISTSCPFGFTKNSFLKFKFFKETSYPSIVRLAISLSSLILPDISAIN